MLCVVFFFVLLCFDLFWQGVLELFWMGEFDSVYFVFFVRAKTSRHFSGAPVCISFSSFVCLLPVITIICIFFFFLDLLRKKTKSVF